MSMREQKRKLCLRITKELIDNPCAMLFYNPVDKEKKKDYYEKIKNPKDLKTILEKLENKGYPTVKSWEDDISLIWHNCGVYNNFNNYEYDMALELRSHFKKLYDKYMIYNAELWIKRIQSIYEKLEEVIVSRPDFAKKFLNIKIRKNKNKNENFSNEDCASLLRALETLNSPADIMFFVNTFYKLEKEVPAKQDPLDVNLSNLSQKTLKELKSYAKNRYKEKGMKYPS